MLRVVVLADMRVWEIIISELELFLELELIPDFTLGKTQTCT